MQLEGALRHVYSAAMFSSRVPYSSVSEEVNNELQPRSSTLDDSKSIIVLRQATCGEVVGHGVEGQERSRVPLDAWIERYPSLSHLILQS